MFLKTKKVLIFEVVYINKLNLPICPYCKYKLSFIDAFVNKNRPIYKCRVCQRKSSVNLDPVIFKYLWCVQIFSILIFVMTLIGGGGFLILGFALIFLLFLGFYFISSYMMYLEEPIYISVRKNKQEKKEDEKTNNINHTTKETLQKNEEEIDIYSN